MGKVTVYCTVSGCTPEIARNLSFDLDEGVYGPVVARAVESLADDHELSSQDDLCVISPLDPSGLPCWEELFAGPRPSGPPSQSDVRVIPHCVMGDSWEFGFVDSPPPHDRCYLVSYGYALMVQAYALDIMALATCGRLTPLRLWRLAMQQGFEDAGRPACLLGADYGDIADYWEQFPVGFPGFTEEELSGLEETEDVEAVKHRLVHEGCFWLWMAPDRFPVSPTRFDHALTLPETSLSTNYSAIESLPPGVFTPILIFLSLPSLLNLASTSRALRSAILGSDHLACTWIYDNAPWWIPVPTQTPRKDRNKSLPTAQFYLPTEWAVDFQLTVGFPAGLDWAYILRCARSGSMRNRRRIWKTVLDIEFAADQAGA